MDEQTPTTDQPIQVERVEDFVAGYANNIQFEPSAWDLKIVFGELNQARGKLTIEQHTSMTVSWAEAKMLSYYLQIQIAAYELQNGKIQLPKSVLPPEAAPVPADAQDKETAEILRQMVIKMREEFLANI